MTGVPRAVGDVLARRLARLPGDVVDLLAIAAVTGKRFAIAAVAGIAGLPAEEAVPLVDSAVRAGVVEQDSPGGGRFSHDLFRDVLYEGLPAARRSALHLAVAELLERDADLAAPAAQIAYHRTMALPLGDRGRALAALIEAGREATARMAFDEAAGHLAVPSRSLAASRPPVSGCCASTVTRCAGPGTARTRGPRSSPPPGAPARPAIPRCWPAPRSACTAWPR